MLRCAVQGMRGGVAVGGAVECRCRVDNIMSKDPPHSIFFFFSVRFRSACMAALAIPPSRNGMLDQTQAYCMALLNQEKSLEELQRHLHKTEELFRESVRRKNQQLDVLQAEVRRLKSNVAGREIEASESLEDALSAQTAELERLRLQLATRDLEVDALAQQVMHLKSDLSEERAWRQAEAQRAAEAASAKVILDEQRIELTELRDQLAAAQSSATRLQAASADAEAALLERDAELKRLRAGEQEAREARTQHQGAELELARLRDQLERAEQEANSHRRAADLEGPHLAAIAQASNAALEAELEAARTAAAAAAARADAAIAEAAEAAAVERRRLSSHMEETRESVAELERRLADGASRRAVLEGEVQSLTKELEAARMFQGESARQVAKLDLPAQPKQPLGEAASPPPAGEPMMLGSLVSASRPVSRSQSERSGVGRGAAPAAPVAHGPAAATGAPAATRAGGEGAPRIVQLKLQGDAVVSCMLTAVATVATPDTSLAYTWFRAGTPLKKSEGPEYTVTAADLRCEISVRVTPFGPGGATGTPQTAATSGNVTVAAEVPHKLREWVRRGESKFDGLLDAGDRERALLFTGGRVKLREVKGNATEKTIAKDPNTSVRSEPIPWLHPRCPFGGQASEALLLCSPLPLLRVEFLPGDLSFILTMPSLLKRGEPVRLKAKSSLQRDLLLLCLAAFQAPDSIAAIPTAPITLKLAFAAELAGAADAGTPKETWPARTDRPAKGPHGVHQAAQLHPLRQPNATPRSLAHATSWSCIGTLGQGFAAYPRPPAHLRAHSRPPPPALPLTGQRSPASSITSEQTDWNALTNSLPKASKSRTISFGRSRSSKE